VAIGAASASLAREDPEAAASATAERVSEWVSEMGLPQRQRDLAILEADLPGLARLAMTSRTIQNYPRPIKDSAEIEALLRAAW
jgi:alcohol dehydrogenase class IV